eukprot:jgi/Botrbrau1/13760/Bobra.0056s0016.1
MANSLPCSGLTGCPSLGKSTFRGKKLAFRGGPAGQRPERTASCPIPATAASTTQLKLPLSHLESSARALEQLKQSKTVNRYATEVKRTMLCLGLSVRHTPIEVREKMSIPEPEWPRAIEELTAFPHIEEAAILSTCNRMEIYLVTISDTRGAMEAKKWMMESSGIDVATLEDCMFMYKDRDAVNHLMRVAGGLDSLVQGEGQILAQCKQVYKVGQNCPNFGRHMNGLFKQAITAGKRVRAETTIASGAVSVSSAAAELALLKLPTNNFEHAKVCIIGAGKMSKLLVKHLVSKGCEKMTILNRSLPRAEDLAAEFSDEGRVQFDIRLMRDLLPSVEEADVIFAASGSEELLVHASDVLAMRAAGEGVGGVRRFFDISVPRNIDPKIDALESAGVWNVDHLQEVVEMNKEQRRAAALEAEDLCWDETYAFEAWRDSLETVPTIKALRGKAEAIRVAELERAMTRLGPLDKKQAKILEEMSRGIMNKLLHGPMMGLRCDGADPKKVGETLANMQALERMFELSRFDPNVPIFEQLGKAPAGAEKS